MQSSREKTSLICAINLCNKNHSVQPSQLLDGWGLVNVHANRPHLCRLATPGSKQQDRWLRDATRAWGTLSWGQSTYVYSARQDLHWIHGRRAAREHSWPVATPHLAPLRRQRGNVTRRRFKQSSCSNVAETWEHTSPTTIPIPLRMPINRG